MEYPWNVKVMVKTELNYISSFKKAKSLNLSPIEYYSYRFQSLNNQWYKPCINNFLKFKRAR